MDQPNHRPIEDQTPAQMDRQDLLLSHLWKNMLYPVAHCAEEMPLCPPDCPDCGGTNTVIVYFTREIIQN